MDFKALYRKYKDLIPYIIFGVLTTVVNTVVYWLCAHQLRMAVMVSTVIAWISAVLFAYVTNRKWVFHSQAESTKEILNELIAFFSCRLATGLADWACMFIFVDLLKQNDLAVKLLSNVLVVILNYIASKFLIFRSKKN